MFPFVLIDPYSARTWKALRVQEYGGHHPRMLISRRTNYKCPVTYHGAERILIPYCFARSITTAVDALNVFDLSREADAKDVVEPACSINTN
jgi:hypothetical protein